MNTLKEKIIKDILPIAVSTAVTIISMTIYALIKTL